MIFLCNDIKVNGEFRHDGAEGQIPPFCINQPIQAKGIADPMFHKKCGVVDQVIGGHHIEDGLIRAKPFQILMPEKCLLRHNHGQGFQLVDVHHLLAGQFAIHRH